MRKFIVSLMGLAMVFTLVAPMPSVHAAVLEEQQALVERLKGHFLLAVQDQGRLWYVLPKTGERMHQADKQSVFALVKENAVVITAAELKVLPTVKQKTLTSATKKAIAARRGYFVSTSATLAQIWYVNPIDGLRYDVSTADKAMGVAVKAALGITNANLDLIAVKGQAPVIVVPEPTTPAPVVEQPVVETPSTVTYQNAQMGWDFASGLWHGYEQYHRAFNDWPDLKWFNNIVPFNLPIYFNETGFSLDSGKENYFVWSNHSAEWKDFYANHFSMKREGDVAYIKFDLPQAVETVQHGVLQAGTYYFSNVNGLQAEKDFSITKTGGSDTPLAPMTREEKAKDAKRVFEGALAISKGLEKYRDAVYGYPVTYEKPLELGVNGITNLCYFGGFGCYAPNIEGNIYYMSSIESARPTTTYMYDSRFGGSSFALTFTIYGSYDQYDPGVYEISPYIVKKVSELPRQ